MSQHSLGVRKSALKQKVDNPDNLSIVIHSKVSLRKKKEKPKIIYNPGEIITDKRILLPKIPSKPGNYEPIPYIFRIPAITSANVQSQTTRCPPLYVQIDHAIAVIWSLFTKKAVQIPLGINQLQWAMSFLRTIRNSKGRIPNDIAFCIDVISNELIEQYAELADKIPHPEKENILREEVADVTPADVSAAPAEDADVAGEEQGAQTIPPNKSTEILVKQNIPFSINYADMMNRSPALPEDTRPKIHQKEPCEEDEAYKNHMMSILGEWRQDQMKKILMDLDRLHSIESYLGQNTNNFEPYMDDKDKEMSVLLAEKMKRAQAQKR